MKKQILTLFTLFYSLATFATKHIVNITLDPMYDPAITNARVGDTITISANNTHPCAQVSAANWAAGITDTLAGGWGVKTSDFSFVLKKTDTLYFMCQNHGPSGMKARIIVQLGLAIPQELHLPLFTIYANPGVNLKFKL